MIVSVERPAEDWSEDRSLAKAKNQVGQNGSTRRVMSLSIWTLPRICKDIFIYLRNSRLEAWLARGSFFHKAVVGGS